MKLKEKIKAFIEQDDLFDELFQFIKIAPVRTHLTMFFLGTFVFLLASMISKTAELLYVILSFAMVLYLPYSILKKLQKQEQEKQDRLN